MTWLFGTLIALVLFVIIILMFPFIVSTESRREYGTLSGIFSISWLILGIQYTIQDKRTEFFLFGRKVRSRQSGPPEKKKPAAIEKPAKPKKSGKMPPLSSVLHIASPLITLFRDLLAIIRLRHLAIDTTYGLDDPGLTGMLAGYLHALRNSLARGRDFRFTPDFTRSTLDWDVSASASVTPIRIFPPVARFVANRQVLRLGWEMLRS